MEPDEDVAELLRRGVSPAPAETVERSVDAVLGRLRADKAAREAKGAQPTQPGTAAEAARTAEGAERGTPESVDAGDTPTAAEVATAGIRDGDRPDPAGAVEPIDRHAGDAAAAARAPV